LSLKGKKKKTNTPGITTVLARTSKAELGPMFGTHCNFEKLCMYHYICGYSWHLRSVDSTASLGLLLIN